MCRNSLQHILKSDRGYPAHRNRFLGGLGKEATGLGLQKGIWAIGFVHVEIENATLETDRDGNTNHARVVGPGFPILGDRLDRNYREFRVACEGPLGRLEIVGSEVDPNPSCGYPAAEVALSLARLARVQS